MENQQLHSHYPSEDRSLLSRAVSRKIPRWLVSKVDGSDLIQDTYVDLLSSPSRSIPSGQQSSMLMNVALKNNFKDCVRRYLSLKRDSKRELHGDYVDGLMSSIDSPPPGRTESRYELIRSLLERLPLAYSAALEAYYLEGATLEQIGQRLSRSKDAVRMLIRRAEAAAERILRADGFSSPSI